MQQTFHVVLWVALALALQCPALGGAARPNIIVILADDLGYGDTTPYGASLIDTPHLEKMASEGVRFTDFYASANVCTPSRASLLTGRYAIRMGLATATITADADHGLPAGERTIAELLQEQGYRTALIGKWHLGHASDQYRPRNHGFGHFFGLLHPNDFPDQPLYRNEEPIDESFDPRSLTQQFTAEAVQFIENNEDESFFLFVSHTAPHIPLLPSEDFSGTSNAGAYGDVVEELDWSVGQLLKSLEDHGLATKTLVLFTSDNGPFPEGSSGGLRGGKGTSWDGGYRVPFIARWRGVIPAGGTSNAIAMNIDLLPTLARAAGLDLPDELLLDGSDITGLLHGSQDSPHDVLYFFHDERIAALRTRRWRLVLSDYPPWRDAKPNLFERSRDLYPMVFDMKNDPDERYDRSGDNADVTARLWTLLDAGRRNLERYSLLPDTEFYNNAEQN